MNIIKRIIRPYIKFKLCTALIFLGLFLDIFIKINGEALIYVDESFISNIYSATFTIAAISGTVLSIVISSFDNNYYGFTVKEILSFKSAEYDLGDLILMSLFTAIISTILLLFEYINTMFIVLISFVYVIVVYMDYVWKISTSDDFCLRLVEDEIGGIINRNEIDNINFIRKRLFTYYKSTLGQVDYRYSVKTLEFIKDTIHKEELEDVNSRKLIDAQITHAFNKSVPIIGYTNAISEVLNLYNIDDVDYFPYDKMDSLIKPIGQLQFYNEEKLSSSSMISIYRDIEKLENLAAEEKSMILYYYFYSIYSNDLISFKYKNILINKYFMNLSDFSWRRPTEYDITRRTVISSILKNNVLLNSNKKLREMVFLNIVESLRENIYSENIEYYNTLAIILLSINFYSFKEKSTLDDNHRKELKLLISLEPTNINKKKNRFLDLISQDVKKVAESIFSIAMGSKKEYSSFEYFPYSFDVKAIVWTQEAIFGLGFKLYFIYYSYIFTSPLELIKNWDDLDLEMKLNILNIFMGLFDDTKKLKDSTISNLEKLSAWLDEKVSFSDSDFKDVYNLMNEELIKINDKVIEKNTLTEKQRLSIEECNSRLIRYIERNKYFGYDDKLSLDDGEELFYPLIIEEIRSDAGYIISRIGQGIKNHLNSIVIERVPTEILSFDIEGVRKISELLRNRNVDSRNYNYVGDFAFKQDVIYSEEYKSLVKKIMTLEYKNIDPIRNYVFFKNDELKFNVEIASFNRRSLDNEECKKFAESFKVTDGHYKIKNALYDKSKAMEVIQSLYEAYDISIRFKSTISEDSGFTVDFDYKIRNQLDRN